MENIEQYKNNKGGKNTIGVILAIIGTLVVVGLAIVIWLLVTGTKVKVSELDTSSATSPTSTVQPSQTSNKKQVELKSETEATSGSGSGSATTTTTETKTKYDDTDKDGYTSESDCDDNNTNINPGASETCDGLDNNCNNQIDEGGSLCSAVNANATCNSGVCVITSCKSGYGNCDSNYNNGCEATMNSTNHCGSCGNKCSALNATATCSGDACIIASCKYGYKDCDASYGNGCETKTSNDINNCGSCGNKCSATKAVTACSSGVCTISSCSSGWGNCDNEFSNGCETNIFTDRYNCGVCGKKCFMWTTCIMGDCG
ncbi:MAG: MopE-related protein [bacterium]